MVKEKIITPVDKINKAVKNQLIKTNYDLFRGGFIDVIEAREFKAKFFNSNNIKKTKENVNQLTGIINNELTIYNNRMKPQELRIGNLVNTPNGVKEVRSIDKFGITYSLDKKHYQEVTFDKISGVELTEDWLLGNGFDEDSENTLKVYRLQPITIYKQDGLFWCDIFLDSLQIKTVHQLQNLLFELNGDIH